MSDKSKIEIGDCVCINFNNAQHTLCSRALVEHVPYSTGESWIFKDLDSGAIHYVSEGCTITLLAKGKEL